MADPLSVTAGVLALVTFGLQASRTLYQTIESLRNHPKAVRDLKEELNGLGQVLAELESAVHDNESANFTVLRCPLKSCGVACKEFNDMVRKCTSNTDDSHWSLRDWAKLKYLGSDVNGFKDSLAGYKSTILIALGGISLQATCVTSEVLREYGQLIRDTKVDLEERLCQIDGKLQTLSSLQPPEDECISRDRIKEEKESVLGCLHICAQVSAFISQKEEDIVQGTSASSEMVASSGSLPATNTTPSSGITMSALGECKAKMKAATLELQARLERLKDHTISSQAENPARILAEKESIEKCLSICSEAAHEAEKARVNIFEDVSVADDSKQMMVSTIGDLISARRIKAGARSLQVMGQMSDVSLQHVSSTGVQSATEAIATGNAADLDRRFGARYGTGYGLGTPTFHGKERGH